jgi:Tfp pilus assembly PilM family ATPase
MWRLGLDRLSRMGLVPGGAMPLAIEFGAASIKMLQLVAGDVPRLHAAAELATPEQLVGDPTKRLAWQLEQLPAFVRSQAIRSRKVVCAIPASQTLCKSIQMSIPLGARPDEMVASMLAEQLNVDPSAICCRHVVAHNPALTGGTGAAEVVAMATSMGVVQQLMDGVRAAKMELAALYPEPLAVLRAFEHITRRAEDASLTSLYLDLGHASTKLTIAHGAQIVFAKTISIGGRTLDHLVARQGRYTPGEAHAARLRLDSLTRRPEPVRAVGSTGIPALDAQMAKDARAAEAAVGEAERRESSTPSGCVAIDEAGAGDRPSIDLSEALEALTEEIGMCMRYYESVFPGRRVGRAIFIGGEARQLPLCQYVAKALRVPASVADPLSRFARLSAPASADDRAKATPSAPTSGAGPMAPDLDRPQPGWAVVSGLAVSPTDI